MGTVSCSESIVDIKICKRGKSCCKCRIILCLFFMEADILKHQYFAVLEGSGLCFSIIADNIGSKSNGLSKKFCKTICCRLH